MRKGWVIFLVLAVIFWKCLPLEEPRPAPRLAEKARAPVSTANRSPAETRAPGVIEDGVIITSAPLPGPLLVDIKNGLFHSDPARRKEAADAAGALRSQALVLAPALISAITSEKDLGAALAIEGALIALGAGLKDYIPLMIGKLRERGDALPYESLLVAQLTPESPGDTGNSFLIDGLSRVIRAVDPTSPELFQVLLELSDPPFTEDESTRQARRWNQGQALAALGRSGPDASRTIPRLVELLEKNRRTDPFMAMDVVAALLNVDPHHEGGRKYLLNELITGKADRRIDVLHGIAMAGPGARDTLPYLLDGMAGDFRVPDDALAALGWAIAQVDPENRRYLDYARKRFERGNPTVRTQTCIVFRRFEFEHPDEAAPWNDITQQCPENPLGYM